MEVMTVAAASRVVAVARTVAAEGVVATARMLLHRVTVVAALTELLHREGM